VEIPIGERPDLPSTFMSFAPIVIPVILIIFNTVLSALKLKQLWAQYLIFLGNPVIAVGIGLIIAIYGLTPKLTRDEVIKRVEEGVSSAGIIILVTGAGGTWDRLGTNADMVHTYHHRMGCFLNINPNSGNYFLTLITL
jgi:GntP family gluconate:H+ symporter